MSTSPSDVPRSRFRVLLVTHELSLTGAPRLALDVFKTVRSAVELRTISEAGGGLEGAYRELGEVRILNRLPGDLDRWRHPLRPRLAKVLGWLQAPGVGMLSRTWKPDVVYVNSVQAITLVPRLQLGHLPILLHVHELGVALDRMSDAHRSLLATLPDRYIAVSNAAADELTLRRGVPKERVTVIPPLIDVDRIEAMARSAPAGENAERPGTFIVGGAGNPHWTKGIELWLLMARTLVDRLGRDTVSFEWVGVRDNAAAVEFRAMVAKLDLGANVRLAAETANPYAAYRRFGVLALTSWEESASLVALENMALQVPVVCFKGAGGPVEAVGDAGVAIDRFSPEEMADSIAALIIDPKRRTEIGRRELARIIALNEPASVAGLISAEIMALAAARAR
jgi:glycosyltransferase involved in cell wall biosynthesis